YLAIRSNILTKESLPLVKTAFAVISGEKSRRNITSVGNAKPTVTAFVVKTFDKKRFNNNTYNKGSSLNYNPNNKGPNLNLKCTNCNKIGHIMDRCFELVCYHAGYVKRNSSSNTKSLSSNNITADMHSNGVSSNNATTSNSHVFISNKHLATLMNLLNENGVSTATANMAGKKCMNIKGTFFNGSVKFTMNFKRFFNGNTDFVVGNISLGWIVDSGANQHMSVFAKILINVIDISYLGLMVGDLNGFKGKQDCGDCNNITADMHSNGVSSNNATTSNSHVFISNKQLATLMNLLNENGVSTATANMAGNISLGWIVDSGANQHMSVFAKILINVIDISYLGLMVGDLNGRVSSNDDGIELSHDNQVDDDSEATSMDENNNTHPVLPILVMRLFCFCS
nr:ribonuclease H-like domain-containing protein [Tanacetum cinerariifolium]